LTTLNISVLGAGLMGHGIASIFAAAGNRVAIYDPDKVALTSVVQRISEIFNLLELSSVNLDNIFTYDKFENAVDQANVVIEAAPERLELKKTIFDQLVQETPVETILATNTSGIPIEQIAEDTKEPERIVGTHFWNPPHLIPLVEVIQSRFTDTEVINKMLEVLEQIGKTAIHVRKDIPGFVGNRLQHALKREAIALVENGICEAEMIDLVVKEGFGKRLAVMGPLENSDLVGLDLTLNIHEFILPSLNNSTKPQKLLQDKVRLGELGMSVGKGFRNWTPKKAAEARENLQKHLVEAAKNRLKIPRN